MEKPIKQCGTGPLQYGLNEDGLFLQTRRGRRLEWEPVRRWMDAAEYQRVQLACELFPAEAYFLLACLDIRGEEHDEVRAQSLLDHMLASNANLNETPAMPNALPYTFEMLIEGDANTDENLNLLYEAGCSDGTFGNVSDQSALRWRWVQAGTQPNDGSVPTLSMAIFTRDASSFEAAMVSAKNAVESVPGLRVIGIRAA